MEIYIEYALLENFLFDFALLYLAIRAAKVPVCIWRMALSAGVGAVFAVIFPLLILPKTLAYVLKFSVGFLMCVLPFKSLKTKKDRGMYALTSIFFFVFSFFFGGVLSAVTRDFFQDSVPQGIVIVGFSLLIAFSVYWIGKLHKKRQIYAFLYDCELIFAEKKVKTQGFWDSGNLAMKDNLPVCFVCPSLFYDVFLEDIFQKERGQVCDEVQIQTLAGKKNVRLYKGRLAVQRGKELLKREVYFAPSKNMLSRGYSLLLPSTIFEENARGEEWGENVDEKECRSKS